MSDYQRRIRKGSTSKSVLIRFQNISGSPSTPATSVGDATAGLVLKYYKLGVAAFDVSIAPVSLTDLSAAFNPGGIKHIADGWCRLDLPNAAFANVPGLEGLLVSATATNLYSDGVFIELVDYNPFTNNPGSTPEKY